MTLKRILIRLIDILLSTRAAVVYLLGFAISIGLATFIENDFGTSSAQKVIYKSWWFTLLLALLSGSIITSIVRFRMVQQRKWSLLAFHVAIIVILIGAAITRYFGFEGIMHIREGGRSNYFLSSESYLQCNASRNETQFNFYEPLLLSTLGNNDWESSYQLGNDQIKIKVLQFIPNPKQVLKSSPSGRPTLKIVMAGENGREEYFLRQGEVSNIRNTIFNFSDSQIEGSIQIAFKNDSLFIRANRELTQMIMATQQRYILIPNAGYYPLALRSMYSDGVGNFVFGDFDPSAIVQIESENPKITNESFEALKVEFSVNNQTDTLFIQGAKGMAPLPQNIMLDGMNISLGYGSKPVFLPFSLALKDFSMERYPGTNSAASYASLVKLEDSRNNLSEDYRIYMNHILNYDGYRFFQSSYDNDELGTYLSVNHDFWGTWVSYFGYALLTIGMVLTLFNKQSRFHLVLQRLRDLDKKSMRMTTIIVGLIVCNLAKAQSLADHSHSHYDIDPHHAKEFSQIIVQDQNGRMKPMHTLDRELMRKISRSESFNGLNADQVVLGMYANSADWFDKKMISISNHPRLHELLKFSGNKASYDMFFDTNGEYILSKEVDHAYSLQPVDRGTYEKELMKIDERVNIMNMIFSGTVFKIIPVPGDPNQTWVASTSHGHNHNQSNNAVAEKFFSAYQGSLQEAMMSGNFYIPDKIVAELVSYQKDNGVGVIPSSSRIHAEIFFNNTHLFNRLAVVYVLLGLVLLISLFWSVFRSKDNLQRLYKIALLLIFITFALHTLGLGLRWYISERAPWSNGYESMIYIAWSTVLAGVIFARKSLGGLAATMILSATILSVAILSYMDPEITPLVPVLRSYWLTIHVSMEAGSYGFLMLGALMGIVNLMLMIFVTPQNKQIVTSKIKELTYLSELTLTGGLIMISIGTYLGGVWANESWGRYWGWDAKETWALVTILIYAFILHMRIIPKLQGLFLYNVATIFGLASVIMTYYGVNYYLSGLHSYATGTPAPMPAWVYIVTLSILSIAILAFWKNRKYALSSL